MKYFGREEYQEGGYIPNGFHWGYVKTWEEDPKPIERYAAFHVTGDRCFLLHYAWPTAYGQQLFNNRMRARFRCEFYRSLVGLPY